MFNWLGNIFPYSDLHSLNLDWILSKMKETAAQAAKAVADAANALAQVAEAKAAALSAQTAAKNAQTAANNAQTAANNAADSAENAVNVAQNAQSAAQTAQTTAQSALNKFPVQTADIANGAVLADKIGAYQITTGKIAPEAVEPGKLGPNEMRLKENPIGYPSATGTIHINYDGTTLAITPGNNFYNALFNKFDTPLARLGGSIVIYDKTVINKTYELLYIKTPIFFYTNAVNTDIRITCGLYAPAGDNVEFDVIIHNNGDGTGTTTIEPGNSVISGDSFTCDITLAPFACEMHRAAK